MVGWFTPKKELFDLVQREFSFSLVDRLRIVAELEKYKWKEDESVWAQKKDKSAHQYEVYFDGEFVCFFGLEKSIDHAYLAVMEGLLKLYKEKKIYWNKDLYELLTPKIKESKLPSATTPEEKIVQEAFKRANKKLKGKRAKPAK